METLETQHLIIRPFVPKDLVALHELLDRDLQWAGSGVSLAQRRQAMSFEIGLSQWQLTGGLYGNRAIVLRGGGKLIGICGFRPWILSPAERALYDPAAEPNEGQSHALELGVGYAIGSPHQGEGFGSEAVGRLIRYAFQELEVGRVYALTYRSNQESVTLMERVGMRVGYNPDPEVVYPWAVGVIERASAAD